MPLNQSNKIIDKLSNKDQTIFGKGKGLTSNYFIYF